MGPTDPNIWDQEIPVPLSTISYVDEGIIEKLPLGTQIVGISASGSSYWARTAKIEALSVNDEEENYFIKVHQGEQGKLMVSTEYESMVVLYKLIPDMVPKPIAWGSFKGIPDTHFFVCRYHRMSGTIPDKTVFPALVAEFHQRSVSPDGKFGFQHATFGGRNLQNFPITDTWEECFSRGMQGIFDAELKVQGPDEELEFLTKATIEKIIPRLLRPLESNGRKIVPCLVHGDMWEGNTSVDLATGAPMIFDATPMYAHNEYELGAWFCPRHDLVPYVEEYKKHCAVSSPEDEFTDRLELYCL